MSQDAMNRAYAKWLASGHELPLVGLPADPVFREVLREELHREANYIDRAADAFFAKYNRDVDALNDLEVEELMQFARLEAFKDAIPQVAEGRAEEFVRAGLDVFREIHGRDPETHEERLAAHQHAEGIFERSRAGLQEKMLDIARRVVEGDS